MRDELPGIPEHGWSADAVLDRIDERRAGDLDWRGGHAFSLVYNPGDEGLEQLLHAVADRYLHENALNPFRYPSLLAMEQEVVAMGCRLLGTAADAGALTSGGTESIFLAVQVARDVARTDRGIAEPQLLTASTAHPAFAKAAKYLDVEHVRVPVGPDGRADVDAMTAAMGDRTGLVVGSAPCYPFGVVDPIGDLAAAAAERGILFHTDACLGGWLLPWLERLGQPVPPWDFRLPGVTSVSADVHKYGYGFKGASIVAYRDRSLLTRQHFWYDDWPGGLYASGTTAGTRPAAPIAGAWAAITHLGVDGYLRMASTVRDTTRRFVDGIGAVPGLAVSPRPDAAAMQITGRGPGPTGPKAAPGATPSLQPAVDLGALGDAMDRRGWALDRQQGGLHLMVSPYHAQVVDRFLEDLRAAAAEGGISEGVAASYGGIA